MEFNTQNPEKNFPTLEQCVAGEITAEKGKFIRDFAEHFADGNNFLAHKQLFENTAVFTKITELLSNTKPPLLADVLRLIMVYTRSEINHRYIQKINGISSIVAVMKQNSTDTDVLEQGCRAFINIGSTDKNRKSIGKDGGIEVVINCLKVGHSSAGLLAAACWCLRNVAVEDGNKKIICQKGGVEEIVKAMQVFPTNVSLQTQASWAIENISLKDDYREYIANCGAILCMLQAMRAFPAEKKLQEACCWAMSNLAPHPKGRDLIRKDAGIELLMAASKNHPDVENIQKYVAEAISAMSDAESDEEEQPPPAAAPQQAAEPKAANLAIIKKGYLTKQGGRIKTWKKRWFVLDASKLTYFKGTDEIHPLGTVNLQSCEGVLEDTNTKKNCFMVVTQLRTYKIVAPSRHEMAEWMVSIKNVIQELAASNRPRSIEGNMFMKLEDREKLKLLSEGSQPDAKKEAKESSGEGSSTPGLKLASDFFNPEERTPAHELEAVLLDLAGKTIEKSSHKPKIDEFLNPGILVAVIARRLVDHVTKERLEETYTKNLRGEKTEFVDAIKLEKILKEIEGEFIKSILEDASLLENLKKVPQKFFSQAWEEQGIRKTMEDRHITFHHLNELMGDQKNESVYSMFGIYDGHGGVRAADYLGVHLHRNVASAIFVGEPPRQPDPAEPPQEAPETPEEPFVTLLKNAFLRTNDNFFNYLNRKALADPCGSTAVSVVRKDEDLYVCWVGDSEASLYFKNEGHMVLCKPHKSSSETEKVRVEKIGGFIQEVGGIPRLNGVLAVTRSFGDARFRRFVVPEPEILKHTMTGAEDFMVLACDGLWDVMTPEDVGDFVRNFRTQKKTTDGLAQALTLEALERKSSDNVSVIVVFF